VDERFLGFEGGGGEGVVEDTVVAGVCCVVDDWV
jgi:hypothetical protein